MVEYFAVFIGNKKTGRIENRCTDVSPQVVGVGGLRVLIKGKLNYFILVAAVIQNCTEGIKNKNSVLVVVV